MGKNDVVSKEVETTIRDDIFSKGEEAETGTTVNIGFVPDSKDSARQMNGFKGCGTDKTIAEECKDIPKSTFGGNNQTEKVSCSDRVFRNNVISSIFLLWNTSVLGWGYGQMGPIFPDLQDLAEVSLKEGSWLFTGFAIGYLAGCLLAGFTQTRYNPNFMLFLYTLLTAISYALLPWIPVFPVMVLMRALSGIGLGGQDTGVMSMLFAIWGNKVGPFNQMVHVVFAVGGILSPLVTKPFLRKVSESLEEANSTETVSGLNSTVTFSSVLTTDTISGNTETRVHYALLISALLFLSAAVPFLAMFVKEPRTNIVRKEEVEKPSAAVERQLPKNVERIVLFILLLNAFVATACIDLFPSFLTTFLIVQLEWTRQDGSSLTSLFFALYAVGNFINVFVSVYVKTTKITVFCYICSVLTLSCVLLSVVFQQSQFVWATVSLSGMSISNIIPTLYMWTQENVTPVTAPVASGLLISGSLGIALNPLLVGFMMDVYSPMWFIYLSLADIIVCALLFSLAMILTKRYKVTVKRDQNDKNAREARNAQINTNFEITHF